MHGVVPEHYFKDMMLALLSNSAVVFPGSDLGLLSLTLFASKGNVASYFFLAETVLKDCIVCLFSAGRRVRNVLILPIVDRALSLKTD